MDSDTSSFTSDPSIARTHARLVSRLLAAASDDGHWEGRLSSSALSTATAVVALAQVDAEAHRAKIQAGLDWLVASANDDGGWGDTVLSLSNIATTALAWAALSLAQTPAQADSAARASQWLQAHGGSAEPAQIAAAIMASYGKDHTFSVPILTMLAISGRLGPDGWRFVARLPFELAAAPHQLYQWLRLPVVSYALPALIAIGQVIHHKRGTLNPLTALLRRATAKRTLALLERIQPQNGGFLEATPLTSFVAMSLAHMGRSDHPVTRRCIAFLTDQQRDDGSWPIDTHLATWVTTLAINALDRDLPPQNVAQTRAWLLRQQYRQVHPYTHAAAGGWSWTPLAGGVPDADDTSGALLALSRLDIDPQLRACAQAGLDWLAQLQNGDGGMPTFCRGWGTLPFDMSCADISAHALAAFWAWRSHGLDSPRYRNTCQRLIHYIKRQQAQAGYWLPLWFGNQHHPERKNPVYGTTRVLLALQAHPSEASAADLDEPITRARAWLRAQANNEGAWGGAKDLPPSLEETALAVEALRKGPGNAADQHAIQKGQTWLVQKTQAGEHTPAAPIGFYFANLWYYEELYPLIFTTAALRPKRDQEPKPL